MNQNKFQSNIIEGSQSLLGMLNGIKTVTNLLRPTYGGKGKNIIIESKLYPYTIVTNDAQTIVQSIKLTDKAEKKGLDLIKELCDRTDRMSGDNRKTTILMTEEILKAASQYSGDTLELKRELDRLIPFVESEIDKVTTQITVNEVADVATTASENPETGRLLQEIYQKIDKDGIIHLESSGTYETSYTFIEGIRFFDTGYLSPSMVHDEQARKDKVKETKAIYEKPLILVTKRKISTDEDINPLLREMEMNGQKDLVIFSQDMDAGVASMLVDLHNSHRFNILIIKAPTLWRDYVYQDFALCTGATIIEDATGKTFKNMSVTNLGTCDKIIVDEDETIIIGTRDISAHIAHLETKQDEDSKRRLSWLTNKTAILRLGANSETDLSYKRLKTADGIRSSQLALKYGVVIGGGKCLSRIAEDLSLTDAGSMLYKAFKAPLDQNIANGCVTIPETIVDSAQTLKNAVRNAIGIASIVLTSSGYVFLPDPTPQELYQLTQQQHAF